MSKSKGMKATTQLTGLLLCLMLMQTAFAAENVTTGKISVRNVTVGNVSIGNTTNENTTIGNATLNSINPPSYFTYLSAGGSTQFIVSFTNGGNKTLTLTPKIVATPDSQNNISASWITISPTNATVAPGSMQNFNIGINTPKDAEGGDYQGAIAFTDGLVPNSKQYIDSMQLSITVQAQPKIELQSTYLSDTLEVGKEYDYQIKMKNIAASDITIDPKSSNYSYNPVYSQAFSNDAIEIFAPSTIKAGEVANMTIKVHVPENATGDYNGYIDMNVNGKANDGTNPQINLYFNVWQKPTVPYMKTFSTTTNAPITIEVSTDSYDSAMGLRTLPKKEDPSFNLGLTHNSSHVNLTFVKSVESGNVNVGISNPVSAMENENIYQDYGNHYVETYRAPGVIGNWELTILPKNTNNFGYSITMGDTNPTITGSTTAGSTTTVNTTTVNTTADNTTANNTTTGNATNEVVADFSASPTCGEEPLQVTFTDMSTGSPNSWEWCFGDGTSSTAQNPVHTYCKAGKYTVDLTVKNTAGCDTKTMRDYITVTE